MSSRPLIVLKFGSSVLAAESTIPVAVHEIYRWYRRGFDVVAVVSAIGRTTDKLIAQAKEYREEPEPAHLASLLATGESISAGLVALALDRAGVPAAILDPARIGLQTRGDVLDSEPCAVDAGQIRSALAQHHVAVVPGFFGRLADGRTALLGRGGSDLSALFIAHALGARCRLVKDVDGLYESDPNRPGPRPRKYEAISYDDALAIDGRIVQHKAVRFAKSLGLAFEVSAPQADKPTVVHGGATRLDESRQPSRPIKVALLGLGTVGLGVYRELLSDPERFEVTRIAVRDVQKHLDHAPPELLTDDPWEVVEGDADVIVEAIGGRFPAFDLLARAIETGKHIITANKAVIAHDGNVLRHAAVQARVSLSFSAAVGGAAPIIESVRRAAASNSGIRCVEGVVNGTTNYILDRIVKGEALEDAIIGAQVAGFAEADPTTDLDGTDASHKLAILASEALGERIDPASIDRDSLVKLDPARARDAAACGCTLRVVARAHRAGSQLSCSVRLQTLPRDHPLAGAYNEWNRLLIHTTDGATSLISGRGAGRWPTTESVLADLFDVSRLVQPTLVEATQPSQQPGVTVTAPRSSTSGVVPNLN